MRVWTALSLLLVLVPTTAAQEAVEPVFEIAYPSVGQPISSTEPTLLLVPWSYTFANPLTAAASGIVVGEAQITWSLTCPEAIHLLDPKSTTIVLDPVQARYTGTAALSLQADPTTPGLKLLECELQGLVGAGEPTLEAGDVNVVNLYAAWQSNFTVTATQASRMAGPQKQSAYPLEIANHGNTPMTFRWDVADPPGAGWSLILPEPIVVDPGQSATVMMVLATPFHNGYNKGSTEFEVRAIASPVQDSDLTAEPQAIRLGAQVRGWYVPGPSFALVALALGLCSIAARASRPPFEPK